MRMIFVVLVGLFASGCATMVTQHDGTTQRLAPCIQSCVRLNVTNSCVPFLKIEDVNRVRFQALPYGETARITLQSMPFTNDRKVVLSAKGYDRGGNYLGIQSREFYFSRAEILEEVWDVNYLSLPNGGGCVPPDTVPRSD